MLFSRQYRALWKLAGLWAIPWTIVGAVLGILGYPGYLELARSFAMPMLGYVALNALAFGAIGQVSGLCTGLVLARAERERESSQLSLGRTALWGVLGGFVPFAVIAVFAWLLVTTGTNLGLIVGLGAANGVLSGALVAGAVQVARRGTAVGQGAGREALSAQSGSGADS